MMSAPENNTTVEIIDLSSLSLALVGGHAATRREVIRELSESYRLDDAIEVAPSSENYIDSSSVQTKISGCNLIAVITGYMRYDLSRIVSSLKKDDALVGEVLLLPCRGKSSVVRELIN